MALSLRQAYSSYAPSNAQTGVVVVAGDLIIVGYSYNALSVAAVGCSDNASGGTNSYNEADNIAGNDGAGGVAAHVFYAIAKASETLTITCTAESDNGIHVHVVSGNNQTLASVLDIANAAFDSGASTAHTSASVLTTNADDYLFVYWANENGWGDITENGTNFTRESVQNTHSSATFDRIVSSTNTYADTITLVNSRTIASIICAFKAAATAGAAGKSVILSR
jgi:hypothetical protein